MRIPIHPGARLPRLTRVQQAHYNDRLRRMKAAYERHNLVPGQILEKALQLRKDKNNG
jgi:hypothetical protein